MERVIYIRQEKNLRCKGIDRYAYDFHNCHGDEHSCIEINVIFENETLCLKCTRRIDCLVSPKRCKTHVYWHICNGNSSGVYFTPDYKSSGYLRDRDVKKAFTALVGDEKKFRELTGLTFDDVVDKLYGWR